MRSLYFVAFLMWKEMRARSLIILRAQKSPTFVRRKSDENPTNFLLKVRLCLCYTVYADGLHPHFGCCKKRIQDLDKLIERIYEDQVLGNISAERYARMSVNYENEQRTLINKVAEDEKKLACIEQTSLDLKTLLKVLRSSTSFEELTPTLVNSLIRRIEVHNNDKSSGHCYVKVDIYFTAIGLIDIPTEDEIKSLMAKIKANPQEYRLTA